MIGLAERRRRWRLHENMIKDKHSEEQEGSVEKDGVQQIFSSSLNLGETVCSHLHVRVKHVCRCVGCLTGICCSMRTDD